MTRRERLERKLEKRREWAEGRKDKAAALLKRNEPFRGDYAFNTQPGHIPERARVIAREDRAFGHLQVAEHHELKADGLESQLDRAIFSDDEDAVDKLVEKIAKLERRREQNNAVNRIIRARPKNEPSPDKLAQLVALGISEANAAELFKPDFCGRIGIPSYVNQNISGNITRLRKRLEDIQRRKARAEKAEQSGGVFIQKSSDGVYCSVTFAEKPARDVLNELKSAGFHWGSGSWSGHTERLPDSVKAMIQEA